MAKKTKPKEKEEKNEKGKTDKGKKEKETIRESASKLKKDLEDFLSLVENSGSGLDSEELQGFEERQFEHITSKIADAILNRIDEEKFREISEKLKKGKISLQEAASELKLKMGDLFLVLEAKKVFTEEELRKKLSEKVKNRKT